MSVIRKTAIVFLSLTALPWHAFAADPVAQSFSDVPPSHPAFAAVEYLKAKSIVQGSNGKFDPDGKLTRAQAVKILVTSVASQSELEKAANPGFTDVPGGAWHEKYVYVAAKRKLVDAPPKATVFNPDKPVTKVAFIKMLLASRQINAMTAYDNIKTGLALDLQDATQWEYPYMRYAVSSSMVTVAKDGKLHAGEEIDRADMALLLYRLDMYRAGRRTQALLSETETNLTSALQMLDAKRLDDAKFAAVRSRLTALGALGSKPNEPIVKGAVKVAESFYMLVESYEAGLKGDSTRVLQLSKDAWNLAGKARQFSPGLGSISGQMQGIATNMAEEARKVKSGSSNN